MDPSAQRADAGRHLAMIGARFGVGDNPVGSSQVHSGHVHDTYIVSYGSERDFRRYVHQRISPIFADVSGLMSNLALICVHLEGKYAGGALSTPGAGGASEGGSPRRRPLRMLRSSDGEHYWVDPDQRAWRTFEMVEGAHPCEQVLTPFQAYQVGAAFGSYLATLDDLAPPAPAGASRAPVLFETIPRFHDLDRYLAGLEESAQEDVAGRMAQDGSAATLNEVLRRRWIADEVRGAIAAGVLPKRTVHNDCKSANVLCDDITGAWVCVIDLDTTMSGYVMHDFGDIVRTCATSAAEDEEDPRLSCIDLDLFAAAATGYLNECGWLLSDVELDSLVLGALAMSYEAAVRFLTDYLRGDTYFHVESPTHNLRRCRAQLALLDSIVVNRAELAGIARGCQIACLGDSGSGGGR